jgi:hypothetical protein
MVGQAGSSQIDVNQALRERLGRARAGGTWARQATELSLAVNDLQDLARSRFAPNGDDLRR